MSTLPRKLVNGLLAGAAGGAAMSISTNTEMRLRGRPPSRIPAQTVERLMGIELGERAEDALTSAGHVVTSAVLGIARGVLDAAPVPPALAPSAFAGLACLPDFVLLPALGSAPPPWQWSGADLGTSALHHGVYATSTNLAYSRLSRRILPPVRGA